MTITSLGCPPPPLQTGVTFRSYQGDSDQPIIVRFDHMGINILGFTEISARA